jgi:hypothetical protein
MNVNRLNVSNFRQRSLVDVLRASQGLWRLGTSHEYGDSTGFILLPRRVRPHSLKGQLAYMRMRGFDVLFISAASDRKIGTDELQLLKEQEQITYASG